MKYYLLFFFLILFQFPTQAQNGKIDSLEYLLNKTSNDTIRLRLLDELIIECDIKDNLKYSEPALKIINELLLVTKDLKQKKVLLQRKANALLVKGSYYGSIGDTANVRINVEKILSIYHEIKDTVNLFLTMDNYGNFFQGRSNLHKALEWFQKGLTMSKEMNYKKGVAISTLRLGVLYNSQGDSVQALVNLKKTLQIYFELKDTICISQTLVNIGNIYSKSNIAKSLEYYNRAIFYSEKIKNIEGISSTYKIIGDMYYNNNYLLNALLYFQRALVKAAEINNKYLAGFECNYIAQVYLKLGDITNSNNYIRRALSIAEENNKYIAAHSYFLLAQISLKQKNNKEAKIYSDSALYYSKINTTVELFRDNEHFAAIIDSTIGDGYGAYQHYKRYIYLRDRLKSEEILSTAAKEKFQSELEKQKSVQEKRELLANEEKKKQKIIIFSVAIGLLLVLIFTGFILRSLKITRTQKKLVEEKNSLLNQQNEEILTQKDEIETQRDEISAQRDTVTKQKDQIQHILSEVTNSIRYAERIQQALLPQKEIIETTLSEYFILFQPKDIVSGDFYWFIKKNNWLLVAVADCTGHGVPGAFMSMLGISFLNEIVSKEEIIDSSKVLNELRKCIIRSLQQKGIYGEQKDGMDISFIAIDIAENILQYSGANNPLYIIKHDNKNELIEIKADKMPIGIYEEMNTFTNHKIEINKGDTLYIFSDGFIDQFGGEKRKKFLSKNFKNSLLKIVNFPLIEQKNNLIEIFENWKGDSEQIDDITILGIRI